MRRALAGTGEVPTWVRPWRLPTQAQSPMAQSITPASLVRFVGARCEAEGLPLPGFSAAELAARAWARQRTDKLLHTKFVLRALSSRWAAQHMTDATCVVAPSNAARAIFGSANRRARKILIVDMPHLRGLHEDLQRQVLTHSHCRYLSRYRAPQWALVDQEVELRLADEIWVRGGFLHDRLRKQGIYDGRVRVLEFPEVAVARQPGAGAHELHVVLAGLAAARSGTNELLDAVGARPWLRIHARCGEGSEPAAFVSHPQVVPLMQASLLAADAVLAPCFTEAYLPELPIAAAAEIPIVATRRGAGSVPSHALFALLPDHIGGELGAALDTLYARKQEVGKQEVGESHANLGQTLRYS